MSLYQILVNKPCVWILKELYEAEVINKKVYTIRASDLKKTLNLSNPEMFIGILKENGLLHVDDVPGDEVIALNQKGKDFFKLFDKLKVLTESQVKVVEEKPIATIEYSLSDDEKKALFSVYKITEDSNDPPISFILEQKKYDGVYNKLQKLNLIAKVKNPRGKGMTISLTPAGKRVIQDEFSKKLK